MEKKKFHINDNVVKTIFVLIAATLATFPVTNSISIGLTIAEIFSAYVFFPKMKDTNIQREDIYNKLLQFGMPSFLFLLLILINLQLFIPIMIASGMALIISLLTKDSESMFHSVGMFLFPILEFIGIEGSRGTLFSLFEPLQTYAKTENVTYYLLFWLLNVGVMYALHNISFAIFNNKRKAFNFFGGLTTVICTLNAISILFLNRLFDLSAIMEIMNTIKSTTDWSVYLNGSLLFKQEIVSAIIFPVLFFPFAENFTTESAGYLNKKQRILRVLLGIVLLLIVIFSLIYLLNKMNVLQLPMQNSLLSSLFANFNLIKK